MKMANRQPPQDDGRMAANQKDRLQVNCAVGLLGGMDLHLQLLGQK